MDTSDALGLVGGTLGLKALSEILVARFVKKAEKNADKIEETQVATLNGVALSLAEVKTSVTEMKGDMRMLTAELHHARGEGSKTAERIDGISENHGERLANLENRVTVLETKAGRAKR